MNWNCDVFFFQIGFALVCERCFRFCELLEAIRFTTTAEKQSCTLPDTLCRTVKLVGGLVYSDRTNIQIWGTAIGVQLSANIALCITTRIRFLRLMHNLFSHHIPFQDHFTFPLTNSLCPSLSVFVSLGCLLFWHVEYLQCGSTFRDNCQI